MWLYAVVFHAGNHYYFGGNNTKKDFNSILKLEERSWTWSRIGEMNSHRIGLGVIRVEETFIIVGGQDTNGQMHNDKMYNEACMYKTNEKKISCTEFSSFLVSYLYDPILFHNDDNRDCYEEH